MERIPQKIGPDRTKQFDPGIVAKTVAALLKYARRRRNKDQITTLGGRDKRMKTGSPIAGGSG